MCKEWELKALTDIQELERDLESRMEGEVQKVLLRGLTDDSRPRSLVYFNNGKCIRVLMQMESNLIYTFVSSLTDMVEEAGIVKVVDVVEYKDNIDLGQFVNLHREMAVKSGYDFREVSK